MRVNVVKLPKDLLQAHLEGRAVVVFDVLRATTTMATALAHGAKEIRVFDSLDAAAKASAEFHGDKLLTGETRAIKPPGFDLGNSPDEFTAEIVAGKTIFMSTTNGTRAIVAAAGAKRLFTAALVNATATGKMLSHLGLDVTLLCSGTQGTFAREDFLGAVAVGAAIEREINCDDAEFTKLKAHFRRDLSAELRKTLGGQHIIAAGLERDIDFAAQVDLFDCIVEVTGTPPVARKNS